MPVLLAGEQETVSRSVIQSWIREGHVTLNGGKVKGKQTVAPGDSVQVSRPEEKPLELLAEEIPLEILFEDDDLIVINKPVGIVVHPGAGNTTGTLVNALLHHCKGRLSRLADEDRPGIVHRLDKDTSGCLVAAKSDRAYTSLVAQFSGRVTEKHYLAVVEGVPAIETGRIENQIGRHPVNRQKMSVRPKPEGKTAITEYDVIKEDSDRKWASVHCRILTGRTHQIRVHMKETLSCPILGDVIYAKVSRQKTKVDRLMLHARSLSFAHPADASQKIEIEAPLPESFLQFFPGD